MPKRTFNQLATALVSQNTRSKRPRLQPGLKYTTSSNKFPWISATKTFNYMNDDPLIDWLENSGYQNRGRSQSIDNNVTTETFTEYIRRKGIEFEARVISHINDNIHPVEKAADFYSLDGVQKTRELMKRGCPIIHSAPLCHNASKTYGIADLLVRNDYIKKIAPNTDFEVPEHGSRFSPNFYYMVIDIKFSTLKLNSKGRCLLNQGSMPAYKSQVWIYNRALSATQRFTPPCAFILGRRWSYTERGNKYNSELCFDRMGVVDIYDYDQRIIDKARKAIRWCRDVRNNGVKWNVNPPSRDELYPNMCRDNVKWSSTKRTMAENLGEITSVWMCGVKNRTKAFKNGVRDWRDPRATSSTLGVNGTRGVIVDKMLQINRQTTTTVSPSVVSEDHMAWRSCDNEVFVDFETFSDIFKEDGDDVSVQKRDNLIYQIGLGYNDNGWKYKYFICHEPTKNEEFRIMKEFMDFLKSRNTEVAWYWHAEDNFWKRACKIQFNRPDIAPEDKDQIIYWNMASKWRDMRKLFVKEHIVVRGCFGYGLKNIARSLKNMNLIDTPLESECSNGRTAMVQAWKCYQKFERPWKCGAMKDVTQYNEFDCRVLHDILNYLRTNH